MTTTTERTGSRAPDQGAVYDIGYRSYSGPREGRHRARLAVFKNGVRTALGLGRGARAKALSWLFITILAGLALIMAMVAGAVNRLGGPGTAEQINLPTHSDYYESASFILLIFAAVVAPELLCRDRRDRVIDLYLVRPLTGSDYILARWTAFLSVMTGVCWLAQFILLFGLAMGDPAPGTYLREHWLDVPRFLAAGLAVSAYTTTLAMLTASFTTRRAFAAVFLVGLFAITGPFITGLASELEGAAAQWISMFNLMEIPVHVNDMIFGDAAGSTGAASAGSLPNPVRLAWYFAWTLVPGAILWLRYRRLTP